MTYRFDLIRPDGEPLEDPAVLRERPFVSTHQSFESDAEFFEPGEELATAMNTALALGEPLLLTGEPGTGKTQAAYFLAYRLGVPVIHFQVKSESTSKDLLYHYDSVRYFHDASTDKSGRQLDKQDYVEYRGLGRAMIEAQADGVPRVVLLDEIDKAPRDFPNDLLLELDQICRRWLQDKESVEDVLQGAVGKAFRDFDLFAEGTNFRAWIFKYVNPYPGMPPEVMERDIMSRLERWTGQSVGIEHQEAKAMLGVSIVKDFFREDISDSGGAVVVGAGGRERELRVCRPKRNLPEEAHQHELPGRVRCGDRLGFVRRRPGGSGRRRTTRGRTASRGRQRIVGNLIGQRVQSSNA